MVSCFHCSALTLEDDIRLIGGLINGFLRSISFGNDFEQQLSFYVEARASFCNIDYVLMFLVQVCVGRGGKGGGIDCIEVRTTACDPLSVMQHFTWRALDLKLNAATIFMQNI